MLTGPVAFTVTVPPAPFPSRKIGPNCNPLLLWISAPLLKLILPALIVMAPAGPSPPVEVKIDPPSNIVSLGVLTVTVPALPGPNVAALIALGKFTNVSGVSVPKLIDCVLNPEIDSCSDAVTDTLPPGPEPKLVAPVIADPSVKIIVLAWMFRSPAPPGPSTEDAILAPLMVRVEVDMETGPACPKPKLTLTISLPTFRKNVGPCWKVPGKEPDMVIESDALICSL